MLEKRRRFLDRSILPPTMAPTITLFVQNLTDLASSPFPFFSPFQERRGNGWTKTLSRLFFFSCAFLHYSFLDNTIGRIWRRKGKAFFSLAPAISPLLPFYRGMHTGYFVHCAPIHPHFLGRKEERMGEKRKRVVSFPSFLTKKLYCVRIPATKNMKKKIISSRLAYFFMFQSVKLNFRGTYMLCEYSSA